MSRWVVKPLGDDKFYVQDTQLGYCTDPMPRREAQRVADLRNTQDEAANKLIAMNEELKRNPRANLPSLRERLDLYYTATGTTAADYEPDDPEG